MKRVVFMGMGGAITHEAFWALTEADIHIVGVVKPFPFYEPNKPVGRLHRKKWWTRRARSRTRLDTLTMCEIIPRLGIDVLEVRNPNHPHVIAWLQERKPDLICVASFPSLFKQELLHLPTYGCINLHASHLPNYRGPSPLFWMLKEGAEKAGASVHFLDSGIDSGDLISQTSLPVPHGIRGRELNQKIGETGAPLLVQAALDTLEERVLHTPQTDKGSYHPNPTPQDLQIHTQQPAHALFHFVHGVARWMPLTFSLEEHTFSIEDAIEYSNTQSIPGEFLFHQGILTLSCEDGVVKMKAK